MFTNPPSRSLVPFPTRNPAQAKASKTKTEPLREAILARMLDRTSVVGEAEVDSSKDNAGRLRRTSRANRASNPVRTATTPNSGIAGRHLLVPFRHLQLKSEDARVWLSEQLSLTSTSDVPSFVSRFLFVQEPGRFLLSLQMHLFWSCFFVMITHTVANDSMA